MKCRSLLWLSLTSFVTLSYAQTPLVLELSATTVTSGEQLTASCTATVAAQSRVLYIDGQDVAVRITPNSRLTSNYAVDVTTTWIIDPVQRGDGGEYSCFAGGDQGSDTDSPPQNVTVYFSPFATIAVPAKNVLSGQSTAVVISVNAVPEVTDIQVFLPSPNASKPSLFAEGITYNNVTLKFPSVSGLTHGNVILNFSSVNRYNNGAHTVIFTNALGSGTIDIQLTVYYGPFFSYDGKEQMDGASITINTSENDDVIITCNVTTTNPILTSLKLTSRPIARTYTCTADNGVTTPTNINFVLVVNADPTTATANIPTESSTEVECAEGANDCFLVAGLSVILASLVTVITSSSVTLIITMCLCRHRPLPQPLHHTPCPDCEDKSLKLSSNVAYGEVHHQSTTQLVTSM